MNDFATLLYGLAVVAVVLLLFFLFQGDPDVWDMLRARAMVALQP